MEEQEALKQILSRLDILISLELEKPAGPERARIATRIHRLSALGLSNSEIARILRKPANYVTATISQRKKTARTEEV